MVIKVPSCKGCGVAFEFNFIKKRKKFCSTKCEQDYFNHLYQKKVKEKYPTWKCDCGKTEQLDFNPTKDHNKWNNYLPKHKCI